jgi:hypothetical protein
VDGKTRTHRGLGLGGASGRRRCDANSRKGALAVDEWLVRLVLWRRCMSTNGVACKPPSWHFIFWPCTICSRNTHLARRPVRAPHIRLVVGFMCLLFFVDWRRRRSAGCLRRLTIVGGVRGAWSDWRRGHPGTVCAHVACPTWSSGPSTSPLDGVTRAPSCRTTAATRETPACVPSSTSPLDEWDEWEAWL